MGEKVRGGQGIRTLMVPITWLGQQNETPRHRAENQLSIDVENIMQHKLNEFLKYVTEAYLYDFSGNRTRWKNPPVFVTDHIEIRERPATRTEFGLLMYIISWHVELESM